MLRRYCGLLAAAWAVLAPDIALSQTDMKRPNGVPGGLDVPEGRAELSSGYDLAGQSWSSYATAVFALNGPLHRNGWRLRFSGLYGTYNYLSSYSYCQLSAEEKKRLTGTNLSRRCNEIAGNPPEGEAAAVLTDELARLGLTLKGDQIDALILHRATRYEIGVTPGYQFFMGPLILKAYAGLGYEHHDISPGDNDSSRSDGHWGMQARLESWLTLDEHGWVSADAAYFTGTSSYSAEVKLGYRPVSWLSAGPHLAAYATQEDVSARAGAFIRFENNGMETTLSGGVSGTYKGEPTTYGTANIFVRF